ncbi:MAG: hypothetical protein ABDH49_00775, partial [Candidatus Hydrothermales bacterium]
RGDSFYSFKNTHIITDSNYFLINEKIPITKNIIFPQAEFKILSFIVNKDADTQELISWILSPEIDSFYMFSLAPQRILTSGNSIALVPIFKNPSNKKIINDSLFVRILLWGGMDGSIQREFILAKGWIDSAGHRNTIILKITDYNLEIPPIYMGYCYRGYVNGRFCSVFKRSGIPIYTHFMLFGYTRIIGGGSGPYNDILNPYGGPCRILIPGKFHKFYYKIFGYTDLKFRSWGYFKPPSAEKKEWNFVIEPGKTVIIPDSFYVPDNVGIGEYYGEGKFPFNTLSDTHVWEVRSPLIMDLGVPFTIEIKNPNDSVHIPLLNYGSFPEDLNTRLSTETLTTKKRHYTLNHLRLKPFHFVDYTFRKTL